MSFCFCGIIHICITKKNIEMKPELLAGPIDFLLVGGTKDYWHLLLLALPLANEIFIGCPRSIRKPIMR